MKLPYRGVFLAAACLLASPDARAQWTQQQVALKPGWNAVFLEVDPTPEECDAIFAGLPIESVWDFNRQADSAQFVQDPTTLIPGAPGWLTWFPPTHPLSSQANLFILRDGRPYLIKVQDGVAPFTWTVTGKPSLRGLTWQAGGVNFVGFRIGAQPASFQTLFSGESGLSGQPVYALDSTGVWRSVLNLALTAPRPGEAYWVRCVSPTTRSATIQVDAGSRSGLLFGQDGVEQSLRVRNTSAAVRAISVRVLQSATPPVGSPPHAGSVPLEYRDANYAQAEFDWKPLTNTLSFTGLPAGAEWILRLGLRRINLPAAATGAQFQSLLEVTDDLGARWVIPVSAETAPTTTSTGPGLRNLNGNSSACAGLWIGEAVIKAVSQPAHPSNPTLPRPAGGELSFRLIVHVDASGISRLLQRVYFVRKPPTYLPDPENPGFNIIDQPSRTVVLTDESLIPSIVGLGGIVGRRASSAAFGFDQPLGLTGGPFGTDTLNGVIALDYNHPLNPFKHVYHPDHDNLNERFEQPPLAEGKESFTVTRTVALEFTATDPLGLNPPGWGESELGGLYRETISGLHRSALHISGTFRLVRVARVPTLNDSQSAGLAIVGGFDR